MQFAGRAGVQHGCLKGGLQLPGGGTADGLASVAGELERVACQGGDDPAALLRQPPQVFVGQVGLGLAQLRAHGEQLRYLLVTLADEEVGQPGAGARPAEPFDGIGQLPLTGAPRLRRPLVALGHKIARRHPVELAGHRVQVHGDILVLVCPGNSRVARVGTRPQTALPREGQEGRSGGRVVGWSGGRAVEWLPGLRGMWHSHVRMSIHEAGLLRH